MSNYLPRPNSMKRKNMECKNYFKIENNDTKDLSSVKNKTLVDAINLTIKKRAIIGIIYSFIILTTIIVLLFLRNWIALLIGSLVIIITSILMFYAFKKYCIKIEFVLNKEGAQKYNLLLKSIKELTKCQYIWYIKQKSEVLYSRVNAGAPTCVTRNDTWFKWSPLPSYIKSVNLNKFYKLPLDDEVNPKS